MKSVLRIRGALLLLFLFFIPTNIEAKTDAGNPEASGLMKKVLGLQIPFIENQGQIKPVPSKAEGAESVRFYANTFAGTVFVTDKGEIVYSLIKAEPKEDARYKMQDVAAGFSLRNSELSTLSSNTKAVAIKESLVYSNQRPDDRACLPPACRTGRDRQAQNTNKIKGLNKSETKVNYFKGSKENWRTNIPTWQEVSLGEVYKGIELKLKAYGKNVEKLFTVHPQGSVNDIKVKIEGAKRLSINKDGELEVETELGTVKFTKPVAYQEEKIPSPLAGEGKGEGALQNKQYIKVAYVVDGNEYGFQVAHYDKTKPLIIDPFLAYSTYLGGGSAEYGYGIAVDNSGNIYVSGKTNSTSPSPFPTTGSAYQGSNAGGYDIFVAKIDASGLFLIYSTYLGGSGEDSGCGSMTIDSSGNVYLTGYTKSTTDFPTTASAYQGSYGGGTQDAFVTKIDASGSALVYSTYLGGNGFDWPCGWSIAVDSSGNAYVVGETGSTDFPTTASPIQGSNAGGYDAFVTKINPDGTGLVYSTYLGGSGTDASWAIDIDSDGNAYISGYTYSTNFPITPSSAYQTSHAAGGGKDAFVTKINASGSTLLYSTYLGGTGNDDYAHGIAVDSSGNAYITGKTNSTNFPITPSTAYQTSIAGGTGYDVFVTKINTLATSGSEALVYSTYLGGDLYDMGWGIAVDNSGNVYLTGETISTNFPTASPIQGERGGTTTNKDAFVTKINTLTSGSAALFCSTYLGGSSNDFGWDIAVDSSGNVYVVGETDSTDFPTQSPLYGDAGVKDAFVAKISSDAEVCDGIDNDCNGLIDDGIPSTPTTCGVGVCSSTGTLSCVGGTMVDSCTPGAPSGDDDNCNGIDENCNGTSDENYVPVACDGPDSDLCQEGTTSCGAGVIVCSDATGDTLDLCNGADDDCDGSSPDGSEDPGVGIACDGPDSDLCQEGTTQCSGGIITCSDTTGDNVEACDGNDNDCDGSVDEGFLVRIGAVYYSSLQTAYDSAGEGSVIQTQDVQLIEDLSANFNKTVTIDGGYDDCSYAVKTGRTRLKGQMTISNGKAAVKDFIIEQ